MGNARHARNGGRGDPTRIIGRADRLGHVDIRELSDTPRVRRSRANEQVEMPGRRVGRRQHSVIADLRSSLWPAVTCSLNAAARLMVGLDVLCQRWIL